MEGRNFPRGLSWWAVLGTYKELVVREPLLTQKMWSVA